MPYAQEANVSDQPKSNLKATPVQQPQNQALTTTPQPQTGSDQDQHSTGTITHVNRTTIQGNSTTTDPNAMVTDTNEISVNPTDERDEDTLEDSGNDEDVAALEALKTSLKIGGTAGIQTSVATVPITPVEQDEMDDSDFAYQTRYDLMFKLPETREATDELTLISIFTGFINAIQMTDVNAAIVPWRASSVSGPLEIGNLLPNLDAIQVYFPRARINPDKERVYSDVHIAHSVPRIVLEMGVKNWLMNNNASLYLKKLQVEMTRVVGWFMWSHRFIKADLLAHVLAEEHNIHGFFRFSTIYLGKGEKFGPKEGTKALSLVVEWKDFTEASDALKVMYRQGATDFPMGIHLRFMPIMTNISENFLLKMQIFRTQQDDFLNSILTAVSTDIKLMDAQIQGHKTLRNFIMNLKHKGTNGSIDQLFLSVDCMWNDSTKFIFAFVIGHDKAANRMVNTLAAHMLARNQERARLFFTHQAIESAETMQWDPRRECFMTLDEMFYDNMEIWSRDVSQMGVNRDAVTLRINDMKNFQETPPSRIERLLHGTDTCSVGTVASTKHNKRIGGAIDADTDAGSLGGDSISTTGTSRSKRNSAMEKEFAVMKANQMEATRTIVDLTLLIEDMKKFMPGYNAITPAQKKSITIVDSSEDAKQAPSAGIQGDSGDGK